MIGRMDVANLAKVPLGILGAMLQAMTEATFFVLDLSTASYAEALGSGFIGL